MAKLTRLATTVTARYYPAPDITDAFFLDGRLSGKREARAADITVDKEERGFFLSVFSHSVAPGRDPAAEPGYAAPLNKLFAEIKSGRRALDDQIGDLVNTAVSVTGRLKLQADNSRAPFFSGIIVKDSEAFAITMGKGLAFLYRDDTLFPLTATDIRIDPVNTQRQKVENFYNYCAAKTATALCSNIAQLKMDDCLVLCNREVYEALGQQELLRILYDAEDQCDAAGAAITEAAAKLPGVPLQLMISFVESVSAQEKSGLFGFGKKNRQLSYNDSEDEVIEVPMAKAPVAAAPAPAAIPVPVPAEPLYFGNEASNPFVQPVAEQPVTPTGPEDPIHFQDQTLAPFGEPVSDVPQVDEGGFVRFEEQPAAEAPAQEPVSFYQDSDAMPEGYSSPRFIPDEPYELEEGEPLVFGDENAAPTVDEGPFVMQESASAPAVSSYRPTASAPEQNTANATGSFYIPFESKEPAPTASTDVNDIPDMPLYEAPSYTPPTYPSNSYTPRGYDNAGVYARGSYSSDEEPEIPRQPSQPAPANRSYSYTPPQQTVPSYGSTREGMPGQRPQPSAPGTAPRAPQQNPYQQPYPQTGRRTASQDMFEQDQDQRFDYGDSDTAYKRNRLWVFGLIGVSVICVIVLVSVWFSSMNSGKKAAATSLSTSQQSVAVSTAPGASDSIAVTDTTPSDTAPSDTTAVQVIPNAQFFFSDATGFRTWWDVLNKSYSISIEKNSDPRVQAIIAYNGLPADYVPKAGDTILVPPMSYLPSVTPEPAA